MHAAASKGKRYSVMHAGSAEGWIVSASFIEVGNPKGDFHGTITSELFEEWFTNSLLPSLGDRPCLIVMDNASFHKKMDCSLSSMRKAELIKRLVDAGVALDGDETVALLRTAVKFHCPPQPLLENLAKKSGHEILWLPPYHPELNPIEMMWAVMKGYIRSTYAKEGMDVVTFKVRIREGTQRCTADVWSAAVQHALHRAEEYVELDDIKISVVDEKSEVKRSARPSASLESKKAASSEEVSGDEQLDSEIESEAENDDESDKNDEEVIPAATYLKAGGRLPRRPARFMTPSAAAAVHKDRVANEHKRAAASVSGLT